MTPKLRARRPQPRLFSLVLPVLTAFLTGLLLSLTVMASPPEQASPRGTGSGTLWRPLAPSQQGRSNAIRIPLSPDQWTTILSENFEGTWPPPASNWMVFDNDNPPSTNGEYFWANRCAGRNSTRSAWGIGGGANGHALACGASYPNLLDSWMVYGPMDLSQATAAEMNFYFWVNTECVGTNCGTKRDRLWAVVSTNGTNFSGNWWAGNWYQDSSADPNGWVAGSLNLNSYAGQPRVWIAFIFDSDATQVYPGGAYVDDVVVRAYGAGLATPTPTATTCPATATIRTFTTDGTCYKPGAQIGVFVDVGTSLSSQSVRVEATLWSGDVIWASGEETFTAPGQRVIPLQIPADLFPGDYTVVVRVLDANTNCLQAMQERIVRIDPACATVTPPISPTPTGTPTATRTPTPTATTTRPPLVTPTLEATLCPGQSVHETKPISIPPAPGRADVLFVFDTTSSMGGVLSSAKSNAVTIMNNLAGLIPDIQFGVVDLRDYPVSPYGDPGDWPYLLRKSITADRTAVEAAINATSAGGGQDYPEAYTRALFESYSDSAIGWRADTRRFVVMFGDDVPHDNNLNERVTNPPVNPGSTWCGDTSAGCVHDPGRDGQPGTADDLDFQTVLDALKTNRITLLYVVSGGGSTSQENLVTYWKQWASWTNAGGDALSLNNAANLPNVIQSLITSASRHISRLELLADPPSYQSWLTVNPPAYTNLDIPPSGLNVTFEVDIRVPPGTAIGRDYTFAIKAIGDGANYGGQGVIIHVPASCATNTPTPTATRTSTPTRTRTPTATPSPTATACPSARPPVAPSCSGPNYVRNPYFEKFNRGWGEYSSSGREIVSTNMAQEGFYSAHFEGPFDQPADEWIYQVLDIPPDATAASFWVEYQAQGAQGAGMPAPPPITGNNFFRVSLYDLTMTTELVRLWEFNPLSNCPVDPSSFNLSPDQLDLVRGRTVTLVFWLHKEITTGWRTFVVVDGIHFNVCSPSPPCRVERDKTASPGVVPPGGEVTVMLSLTGLDGACLPARKPADVMLVLDRSGSMSGQPIQDAKAAAKSFVDRMDLSMDQVGLVSFATSATLDQTLTQMAGPVRTAIDGLSADGTTNIADSLTLAQGELASGRHRAANQPVLILMSDGRPNVGSDPSGAARAAATAAKAAGTRIFAIGLGNDIDPNLMRDLASSPSDYFFAPDSSQLDAIYQQIAGAIGGSPATNITIVDRLSDYVTLVPNSFTGSPTPDVSPDGRTLTWRIPRLGLETRLWSYRVKMTMTPGTWPTNDYATATYTNSQGQPASLTFPIPQVTVLPPADKHPQIMCRDNPTDTGALPSNPNGEAWWDSPDIWVRNQQDGVLAHQNPIAGQTNYVYVRVRNIGDATVNDITVHVYDTEGAANLRWPDDWVPEIGNATIASLPAGQTALVSIPWTPIVQGHYCFLTRIEAPDDTITFDGWVPFDNNICQKNVQIIEGSASSTGINVGNRGRGSGYGSLTVDSSNIPAMGGTTVTFADPKLFDRWRKAGGTVSGGEIITGTNSIRLNVRTGGSGGGKGEVSAVIDRIPFEGEEVSTVIFAVTGPAGAEPPTLKIMQLMDGQAMGGNILQPPVQIPVYLPLVLRNVAR